MIWSKSYRFITFIDNIGGTGIRHFIYNVFFGSGGNSAVFRLGLKGGLAGERNSKGSASWGKELVGLLLKKIGLWVERTVLVLLD